jgi:hypothetical protein
MLLSQAKQRYEELDDMAASLIGDHVRLVNDNEPQGIE